VICIVGIGPKFNLPTNGDESSLLRNAGSFVNAITASGLGDPRTLSGGIGEALITTAAGLTVAIPSLIAYRFLRSKVERLVVRMEKEAMKLVDALDERGMISGE